MTQLHVVFGTGPIGLATIDHLVARGLPVRAVNRSGRAGVPAGVELVAADANDPAAATDAAAGASVVYQCLNPAYHRWAQDFPPLQAGVVAACRANSARLVSFENVYMYGDTGGTPMTEDTPTRPHTRKGKVRLAMADELRSLYQAGHLDVVTARASDYFGPGALEQSPLGELVIGKALAGKTVQVVGDPSQPHSYTYIPDAGHTMAELGTRNDVGGEVFHVPNAPARSTREIIDMIGDQLGTTVKVQTAPKLLLRAMGLFNPTVREVIEMLYEFEQPFVVDSTKAEQRLGLTATPLDEALAATIAWFRSRTA
ncbi:MAG: NAD-dependent epimerase/dehydratase family protein [Acidobacteriota bacterium]